MTSARADCRTSLSPLEQLLAEQACRHLITKHRVTRNGAAQASSRCSVLLRSGRHSDVAGPNGRPADAAQRLGELLDEFVLTAEG